MTRKHLDEKTATKGSRTSKSFLQRLPFIHGRSPTTHEYCDSEKAPYDESVYPESVFSSIESYNDMSTPYIYDETLGIGRSLPFFFRPGEDTMSEESLFLELVSECSNSEPSDVDGPAARRVTLIPDIPQPYPTARMKVLGKVKSNDNTSLPGLANVSDTSKSSETETTSCSDSSGDKRQEFLKNGRKSNNQQGLSCSQDAILDCAEQYMDTLSNLIWPQWSESQRRQRQSKAASTSTGLEPVSCDTKETACGLASDWDIKVQAKEGEGESEFTGSQEALRSMLNDALQQGGTIVSTTFDTIRQVASTIVEDNPDDSKECESSTIYDDNGTESHGDWSSNPEVDRNVKTKKENRVNIARHNSSELNLNTSWETFADQRQIKKPIHHDTETRYWSNGVDIPKAKTEDSDDFSDLPGYVFPDA